MAPKRAAESSVTAAGLKTKRQRLGNLLSKLHTQAEKLAEQDRTETELLEIMHELVANPDKIQRVREFLNGDFEPTGIFSTRRL